jgi:Zn-dependent protease with chaperone function
VRNLLLTLPLFLSCSNDSGGTKINLYTVSDDIDLGRQLRDEILADPETYPVLNSSEYPTAYSKLYDIRDSILDSGEVRYVEEFDWELYIIEDDEVLNAFCAPGGYIYVYTGLIKFLEHEDELAGVMGHEIAHADLRHSTQQLTQAFGISVLLAILIDGDPGLLSEIAASLVNLSFSRSDESEADETSVEYLCNTQYAADGTAGFFEKLEGFELPEFLSSHPSSDTRVDDITEYATELGCDLTLNPNADYQSLVDALP